MKKLESSGYTYIFVDNVIIPIYFSYDEDEETWYKRYYKHIDMKNSTVPVEMDDKYKYISDEELTKIFGIDNPYVEKQFTLQKK